MTALLVQIALVSFLLGFGVGACLFCRPKRRRNASAPYFHFNGDPQPGGQWRPEFADALRRKGVL